eukprot:SAG11_NODE_735_length_7452_cov_26.426629_7_plen_59_part_00
MTGIAVMRVTHRWVFLGLRSSQVNDGKTAVEIDNPKTIGFEICRTNLLTGSCPCRTRI